MATGVAIVAIPKQDDYVWKISSEKIPHMTLLFLGDISDQSALSRIEEFVAHVAELSLTPFYAEVKKRGVLGPDQADVVFFRENWLTGVSAARTEMLQQPDILAAYNSTQQYEGWTPHLTLGYPASPAKKDDRDYPGVSFVQFDSLALWTGDFEGPTFDLTGPDDRELAMSTEIKSVGYLLHHGIKGMHWGVRKDGSPSAVSISTNPAKTKRVKVSGGRGQDIHPDAARALAGKQQARASGVHTLSNAELKTTVERLNLEAQYSRLTTRNKSEAHRFIEEQLKQIGRAKVKELTNK